MPCYHPLKGYKTAAGPITFNASQSRTGVSIAIPCGQCIGCRTMKSQEWQTRLVHESKCHAKSVFVTLTYNQESVPEDYSLKLRDLQLFMKRLRFSKPDKVRFFAVGEYGDKGLRPHYHLLLFNCDFHTKSIIRIGRTGAPVFTSPELAELWPLGLHEFEAITPGLAGYCARYCMKKMNGNFADDHYTRVSPIDGKVYRVASEFAVMSRRPGIGIDWFLSQSSDAYSFGRSAKGRVVEVREGLIVDGQRRKVPAAYLRKADEETNKHIKRARKRAALKHRANTTPARLKVREEVHSLRAKRLLRELES